MEDFDEDGTLKQFVILQENGISQFEKLIHSLNEFLDLVNEQLPKFDPQLYPHS